MKKRETVKSIHYLRGVAALMVVFFHFRYYLNDTYAQKDLGDMLFSNGAFGVDLFFIISGFIICYATEKKEQRPLVSYTLKRFFRIYPLLIISLVISYLLFGNNDTSILRSMLPLHADYSQQGPFFGYNLLAPVWTITYEISFYLVFLLALSLSHAYRKIITIALILFSFIALQLFLNSGLDLSAYSTYNYVNNPLIKPIMAMLSSPMILEFIYGIILFRLYQSIPVVSAKTKVIINPMMMGIAITSVLMYFSPDFYGHGPTKWGIPSIMLIASLLLYEKTNGLPDIKWLAFLGNISFSLYLTHVIIIKIIRKYEINLGLEDFPAFVFAVTLSIATATLVYYLIEKKSISACRSLLKKLNASKNKENKFISTINNQKEVPYLRHL